MKIDKKKIRKKGVADFNEIKTDWISHFII